MIKINDDIKLIRNSVNEFNATCDRVHFVHTECISLVNEVDRSALQLLEYINQFTEIKILKRSKRFTGILDWIDKLFFFWFKQCGLVASSSAGTIKHSIAAFEKIENQISSGVRDKGTEIMKLETFGKRNEEDMINKYDEIRFKTQLLQYIGSTTVFTQIKPASCSELFPIFPHKTDFVIHLQVE
jgi:replicative superfamily II helicase